MSTDEALLLRIAAGDKQAFNSLYQRYKPKVFGTAFHYLQDSHDAEELAQDVFVELYHSAAKYNAHAAPGTWIYRITVNKCLDKLRYRKAKKRLAFITHFFQPGTHGDIAAPETTDIPGQDEDLRLLYQYLDQLPINQRTALILTQIQELSIKETAAIMNNSPKAVESLTQRAKANLRKLFGKIPEGK